MTLDYLLAEAQAYAGPLWLGSKERYEYAVNHFGQDALSVIADGNLYVAVGIASYVDVYRTGTRLGRIVDKIYQNLHQQARVGIDLQSGGCGIAPQALAVELHQVVEIFLHGYCFALRLGYACQLAVVVDKVQQSLAAPVYYAQCLFCLGGSVGGRGILGF